MTRTDQKRTDHDTIELHREVTETVRGILDFVERTQLQVSESEHDPKSRATPIHTDKAHAKAVVDEFADEGSRRSE
jgi:hypothetical protein